MKLSTARYLLAPDSPAGLAPASTPPPAAKPASTPPPTSTPPASSPPPAAAPQPSDDPFELPKKPDTTPAAKPADGKVVPVDFDKLAPKELRERVKQLNSEKETFTTTIGKLEAKIKELDGRGIDTSALTTRLAEVEKQNNELLANLRAAKQELDPTFIEKFETPINEAAEFAREDFNKLNILDGDGNTSRKADWDTDFKKLFTLYKESPQEALRQASEMFGAAATEVSGMMSKFKELQRVRDSALNKEKLKHKENSAKEIAEQAVKREGVGKLWQETNKRLAESVEDYKSDATDTEAAEARKHALSVFDAQINAADQDDFVKQKILKDAHIRQRVGAYAVQKLQISRLKADNEAKDKIIAELKGIAPGGVQRPGGGDGDKTPESDDDWEQAAIREVKSKGG